MLRLTLLLSLASLANGHIAMWHESMFGLNWPNQADAEYQDYNANAQITPLRQSANTKLKDWFGHGLLDFPPVAGKFLELPAGGDLVAELACNKAFTTLRDPRLGDKPYETYACRGDVGPLHAMITIGDNPVDVTKLGGTALAIAYTSDEHTVKPTDFTVVSVNHTSVYYRETIYPIPADLGACPDGGCLCTWNWIHRAGSGEGYGSEIYQIMFRCKVTGATTSNVLPLGGATVPTLCEDDSSKCITGPKQPMYPYMEEGSNMPEPQWPPNYNMRYGFQDGAQNDLFARSASSGNTTSNLPASSIIKSSSSSVVAASKTAASTKIIAASSAIQTAASSSKIQAVSGTSATPASSTVAIVPVLVATTPISSIAASRSGTPSVRLSASSTVTSSNAASSSAVLASVSTDSSSAVNEEIGSSVTAASAFTTAVKKVKKVCKRKRSRRAF